MKNKNLHIIIVMKYLLNLQCLINCYIGTRKGSKMKIMRLK